MALRVSIILPTYNERGNLDPLLTQLLGLSQQFDLEILVVDDDSADGTAELVRQRAHAEPSLRLIRRVCRSLVCNIFGAWWHAARPHRLIPDLNDNRLRTDRQQ